MTDLANITVLPSGRCRVRIEYAGDVLGGVVDTAAEACALRDAIKRQIADGEMIPAVGATVADLTPLFLASRSKNRASSNDERRWNRHIRDSSVGTLVASAVEPSNVRAWLVELADKKTGYDATRQGNREAKPLSLQTRKHCLNLLRRFFAWAVERETVTRNPCEGIRIKREDGDEDEGFQDTWYLDLADQRRLLDEVLAGDPDRWIVAFAMGTGLRQGEQWCLHLEDVHVAGETPHVVVRYGSYDRVRGRYRSPKGRAGEKHSRVVPLFGLGLEAAKAWLRMLPGYASENPHGLMFPTPTGARREGRLRRWPLIAKAFGVVKRIGRKPWWHLLRHTCASSLTSGWWGRAWRLEEVRDMLGHSVITTTERYAHLAPDALQAVATLANDAWASRHAAVTPSGRRTRNTLVFPLRARTDSNGRPAASKAAALSS